VPCVARLLEHKRALIERHARPDDLKGLVQVASTLLPIAAIWWAIGAGPALPYSAIAGLLLLSLFLLRCFVMMHECGHGSLFRSARLNKAFGFVFGVISGMPQYVWSLHHGHHHSTNGNWAAYRGPMNIVAVDDYARMSAREQRRYRNARNIWMAPLAGFLYLVLNPRLTFLRGGWRMARHVVAGKIARPGVSIAAHARDFSAPYCATAQEYRHMFWNNVVLLAIWGAMTWLLGPLLFFAIYAASLALAGGAAMILFTVQHNFEHSYASCADGWDYHRAALEGTSFLVLPGWLNWFTANIGYHHVHHLSARIPNYCLVACHNEQAQLFTGVTRIRLAQIPAAVKCILWDTQARRIVSIAEYRRRAALPRAAAGGR